MSQTVGVFLRMTLWGNSNPGPRLKLTLRLARAATASATHQIPFLQTRQQRKHRGIDGLRLYLGREICGERTGIVRRIANVRTLHRRRRSRSSRRRRGLRVGVETARTERQTQCDASKRHCI